MRLRRVHGSTGARDASQQDQAHPLPGQQLCTAALTGDLPRLKALLAQGADLAAQGQEGTPLHAAAAAGALEAAQLLLEAGAQVNARDAHGASPLQAAAGGGHLHLMRLLLNAGADQNAADDGGRSAASYALAYRQSAALELLLDARVDPNRPADEQRGFTLLHLAAGGGDEASVRELLTRGSDPNAKDARGHTALHFAAARGEEGVVKLLLEAGARPGVARQADGKTPSDIARQEEQWGVLQLLEKGAHPPGHAAAEDGGDGDDGSAARRSSKSTWHPGMGEHPSTLELLAAVAKGDVEGVRAAARGGAHLNARVRDAFGEGMTPLQTAANAGNLEMLKVLLQEGANPNQSAGTGSTPLQEAILATDCPSEQRLVMVAALLSPALGDRTADPNARAGKHGAAALHLLCQDPRQDRATAEIMAHMLLDAGADPELEDARGIRPLDYCFMQEGATGLWLSRLLVERGATLELPPTALGGSAGTAVCGPFGDAGNVAESSSGVVSLEAGGGSSSSSSGIGGRAGGGSAGGERGSGAEPSGSGSTRAMGEPQQLVLLRHALLHFTDVARTAGVTEDSVAWKAFVGASLARTDMRLRAVAAAAQRCGGWEHADDELVEGVVQGLQAE